MSALRDLLRLTAAEAVRRPTAMLRTSAMTPSASGTAGRTSKPVRWCCCNVESSTTFKSRQASQQTRSLTGHNSCESAVCATPYSAFARKDVRCCCAHAWSRSLTLVSFLSSIPTFCHCRDLSSHSLSSQCRAAHTEAQHQEASIGESLIHIHMSDSLYVNIHTDVTSKPLFGKMLSEHWCMHLFTNWHGGCRF